MQHAEPPGSQRAAAQLRREAVDQDQDRPRRAARVQRGGDRRVVRGVDRLSADGHSLRAQPHIAWDRRPVRDDGYEVIPVGGAVAVHHQAGIGLGYDRSVQRLSEPAGERAGADVPGDVPLERGLGQAESAQPARNRASGVVADDEEFGVAAQILDDDRGGIL